MMAVAAKPRALSWTARLGEPALVALGCLAIVLGLLAFATERTGLYKDDARQYALMADDLSVAVRLPYNFRVLTPLLVHLLPLPREAGFTLVTIVGLALAGLSCHLYLRALGFRLGVAACGTVLLLGSGMTTRMLTTPFYVDALTYTAELAMLWALQRGRERLAVGLLTLGVLNRETALLLLPVYWLQARAWVGPGAPLRAWAPRVLVLSALPCLALALVVTLRVAAAGGLEALPRILWTYGRTFEQDVPSLQEWSDIYTVFGALWLLALVQLWRVVRGGTLPLVRRSLAFGALVVAQLVVSRGDESRNLSHLAPIVLPLAALELERWRSVGRRGPWLLALGTAAGLASMVNFRWTLLPWAGVRYGLVAVGTAAAAGLGVSTRVGRGPRGNQVP